MDTPPSTSIAAPVMKEAASDARNKAARANSSGLAMRFKAWRLARWAMASGVPFICAAIGVSVPPGSSALIRTDWGPNSAANACVKPISPDLLAAYGAAPGKPTVCPTKVDVK